MFLCLDTATSRTTIAVVNGDGELLAESAVARSDPGEVALMQIDAALDVAGVAKSDLIAVVVGVGPGPYTSTRVGCVVAQTIGFVLDIPTVGTCTHDAIALQVVDGRRHAIAHGDNWDPHGPFVVATDARRRELYWAAYDEHGARVRGPEVAKPERVAELARDLFGGQPAIAGDGFDRYPEFAELGQIRRIGPKYPSAHWLVHVIGIDNVLTAALNSSALVDHESAGEDLVDSQARAFSPYPLYLREPDAQPSTKPALTGFQPVDTSTIESSEGLQE